ncbi:MAG: hypothetical protein GY829_11045 [Gammaproteobacteria bacterium]|nr:hypothetical protein [Gammaproteobacteria bacterium]
MKITLQDEDIRQATINYLGTLGFSMTAYDVNIDFIKARKTGLLSADIDLKPVLVEHTVPAESGPLDFSNCED